MDIKICDKCKGFNYKEVINELDKLKLKIKYEIGCNSMCGVGRNNIVIIINNKPIIAKDMNELLEKIKLMNLTEL